MPNVKLVCLFGIYFALAGCKTAAPAAPGATPAATTPQTNAMGAAVEPALKPASTAAGAWGMSVLVASPMKLVADLDALSKSLALPMLLGQSLLPTLTSGLSPGGVTVARETLDHLDVARPVAVIWLVRGSDAPAGWCAAIAFKERASAWGALQKMGTGGAQSEGTIERRLPSGDLVWGAVKDRQLLLSSSRETLLAAGALAITAQGTPMSGQALVTLSPSVLARGTGQPLDVFVSSVLGEAMAEMDKDASGTGKRLTPASKNMTEALLKALVRPLSEIAVARISLEMGDRRGVALRVEAQPTLGSGLAAQAAHVSPYVLDPALPVRSDASAVIAWGDMAPWLADWIQIVEASGPAGHAAGRDLRALVVESLEGGSCAAALGAVPIRFMCSLTVRPGVDASQALAGYLAFLESSNAWEAEIDGRKPTSLKVKHKGKVVEIEKAIERRDPQATALMKTIMGGDALHTALTVKDRRVVLAIGSKPREMLDRYGKPQESMKTAAPILARSLVDTAGADFLGLVDVVSVLGKVLANSKELGGSTLGAMMAAVPGLSDLRAPLVLDGHGGSVAAIEIQVPFGSLQNIARVVSAFMGQMGATPPAR
jgi:hypothetical protein